MKKRKIICKRKMAIAIAAGLIFISLAPNVVADKKKQDEKKQDEKKRVVADEKKRIDPKKNIIAIHDSSSKQYNKSCMECHADVLKEKSLDPSIPAVHVTMFDFAPGKKGDEKQCIWCHRTVDLVQGSAGNLRKQVDANVCALCHGPFDRSGPSSPVKQFYQAGPSPDNPDGPALYDLACAACHKDLANSKVSGESAKEIQKKIGENEGGMGPLKILSTHEIQAIADTLATQGGKD